MRAKPQCQNIILAPPSNCQIKIIVTNSPIFKYIRQWGKTVPDEAFTNTSNSPVISNPGWYCRFLLWDQTPGQYSFVPHCSSINVNYWRLKQTVSCRSGSLQCSTKGWRETAKTHHSATPLSVFKTSETSLRPMDPEFVQNEVIVLVQLLRRKANQVTVSTPAFSLGFSLKMFLSMKETTLFPNISF